MSIEQYDTVAVLVDVLEDNLRRGSVETVIEKWSEDAYEVEFSDHKTGIDYAQVVLKRTRSSNCTSRRHLDTPSTNHLRCYSN